MMHYYERIYCVKIKHIIPSLFSYHKSSNEHHIQCSIQASVFATAAYETEPKPLPASHENSPEKEKKYIKVQFMNSSSRQVCNSTG